MKKINNSLKRNIIKNYLILFIAAGVIFQLYHPYSFADDVKLVDEPFNKKYRRGKTTLELRVFPDKAKLKIEDFNHPYYFKKHDLEDILSSIYYYDKDVMKTLLKKGKKRSRQVFQPDEIKRIVPLLLDAFSRSAPSQDILVKSYSERFLLEGLNNFFTLFMTGDKLNIVFGRIRDRGSVSKSLALAKATVEHYVEPTRIKRSHFWEVERNPGQQFYTDHNNWLMIDFKSELFTQKTEERKKVAVVKFDKKFKPLVDPLEDRIKKLEELLAKKDDASEAPAQGAPEENEPQQIAKIEQSRTNIEEVIDTKQAPVINREPQEPIAEKENVIKEDLVVIREKFFALSELLKEGLITRDDYDKKKKELLSKIVIHKVKDGLEELKSLMEMGFINEDDFNSSKKELLMNM